MDSLTLRQAEAIRDGICEEITRATITSLIQERGRLVFQVENSLKWQMRRICKRVDLEACLRRVGEVEQRNTVTDEDPPSWESIRGIAPDCTGDLSSEEFIRKQRDEWDE